jgi:hypothetical protein
MESPTQREMSIAMGVTYERLDAIRRIVVTVTGPLGAADILSVVDRQADEGVWDYGCLYDERLTTIWPSTVDVVPIARYVQQLAANLGPRGPVAVVADRAGSVEVYSRLSKHFGSQVEVFDDIGEAERWLSKTLLRIDRK